MEIQLTDSATEAARERKELLRLALMGFAALFSWLGVWRLFLPIDLVALASTLIGGYPIYKETFDSLRHKKINMEVSMTLAIFASLMIGAVHCGCGYLVLRDISRTS